MKYGPIVNGKQNHRISFSVPLVKNVINIDIHPHPFSFYQSSVMLIVNPSIPPSSLNLFVFSVPDETWAAIITKIAISVIKLELLLAPLKTQVNIPYLCVFCFPEHCHPCDEVWRALYVSFGYFLTVCFLFYCATGQDRCNRQCRLSPQLQASSVCALQLRKTG